MGLLEEVVAGTLSSGHQPIREGGDFRSLGREGLLQDACRAGLQHQSPHHTGFMATPVSVAGLTGKLATQGCAAEPGELSHFQV